MAPGSLLRVKLGVSPLSRVDEVTPTLATDVSSEVFPGAADADVPSALTSAIAAVRL